MGKRRWNIVVIGSGAGGGPLAMTLSRAGCQVLVLEKGPRYARADYQHDEVASVTRPDFFVPSLAEDPHVLVDAEIADGEPRRTRLGWLACCVGGGTVRMGSSFYRFAPFEFRLRSHLGRMEEVADWPYTYAELEPYYGRAEWQVGVSGASGSGPLESYRSRPYPMPPLRTHSLADVFDAACARLGLHPLVTPRAINSLPYDDRPACAYCGSCAGYGCPVGARGSAQEALISAAERTGRCEVRPNSMVREITLGADGRASGCIYIDASGLEHAVQADVVCVCCSAVESARLLLLSRSPAFPDGLANGSGLVGRHLQFHVGSSGWGRFRRQEYQAANATDRRAFLNRTIADYQLLPDGVTEYSKGGLLRFDLERSPPILTAERVAVDASYRWIWGKPLVERLRHHFREQIEVELEVFQDFLPNCGTFAVLDRDVTDRWGLPVARIHVGRPGHHRAAARWLQARGLEVLREMGAEDVAAGPHGYLNPVLVQGTCRAGVNPAASVLDGYCGSHEVPNLFVVDGSFMPTSGAAPSTLTIMANAFRTADHILHRMRTGDLGARRRRMVAAL